MQSIVGKREQTKLFVAIIVHTPQDDEIMCKSIFGDRHTCIYMEFSSCMTK